MWLLGLESWTWLTIPFSLLVKFSTIISSKSFSYLFFFYSSSWTPMIQMLVHLILSLRSLRPQFFSFFLLYSAFQRLSPPFYLHHWAHWFAFLLQIFCYWFLLFLISVVVLYVSVCLFFNSSRSLLIDSWIFSILFSRFLIIFTTIILNYFSGNLPISSSFIWTSVFLVCSFISVNISLPFHYFLLTYCVWGLLFPGFKVEFFLPFGFYPPKVGMLRQKLQYFGHLMRRVDSLGKTLMLGGIGGRRRRDDRGWDGWMASLTRWTWVWVNSGSWWWTGRPGVLRFMGSHRVGHDWVTELNWTEGWPSGLCELCVGWGLCCFFSLWWAGLSEVVICMLMTEFVFLSCLLFGWGVLHRMMVGWCQVLYSSGFLCESSHYLIIPRVSSLVV